MTKDKGKTKSQKAPAVAGSKGQSAEVSPSKDGIFPVVGIGASAGGLEAFTQLFKSLPAAPGMAFVLVQHLAPAHESMLVELLGKVIDLPVSEVQDGMAVAADNVYVIPPDREMSILQGVLHLMPRSKTGGQYMPIDAFLRSLAEDRRNNAIAVIMSGTGSDGSAGIKAIKAEGGIVFAQDHTARYDGMPRSAIDTGCVDFVLPPEKIGVELVRIRKHPYLAPVRAWDTAIVIPSAQESDLNRIFIMLRSARGVDFTPYKRSTIMRRIIRRMLLQKIDGMGEYVAHLRENPAELETLYQDILINVTSFFREPEAFTALQQSVFPRLVNKARPDVPVRIWVPACSTGEEAYSIAISLIEYMNERKISLPVQLFASDIDDAAVEKARKGTYPENISRDVSPERLRRFFEKSGAGYVINKSVREMCIFARQNMVKDPPFSRIDLISCRNVLIYFGPELQKKTIRTLFYALSPGGFLMIGPSETLGELASLFSTVDKKNNIYAKKADTPWPYLERAAAEYGREQAVPVKKPAGPSTGILDVEKEADAIVLARYSPPGFVVNETLAVLQFRGDTGPYLRPAPGEASLNLLKLIRDDLAAELREALHLAKKTKDRVRKEGSRFKHDQQVGLVNIEVLPFKAPASGQQCFLVLLEESASPPALEKEKEVKGRRKRAAGSQRRAEEEESSLLRQELAASKADLLTVTQEYEAANEELQALNEELQSSNEELQSINEEMETAKEELQSTNEELTTVNDELQSRNAEMIQLNNDLVNVLSGVEIPIILLGGELQIRRFNEAAATMLNLIPADVGRPLSNIRTNINIPDLEQMVIETINTLAVQTREVEDVEGRWFSLTIRPYKTVDNWIDGVLMTLVDIDQLKRSLLRVREAYDYANAIVETVWEPLLVLDSDLRVLTASRSFYKKFLAIPEETEGHYLGELGGGQWDIPELIKLLAEVLEAKKPFWDFEVSAEFPVIGPRTMMLNGRELRPQGSALAEPNREKNAGGMILLAINDITSHRKMEDTQTFLVQSGWVALGEDFFNSLARFLAENLGMDFVCIDRLLGEGLVAQTVAVYSDGKFEDNVSYALKDTPCGDVVGKKICLFPEGVHRLYPRDVILQEMLAESYAGTTLWDSGGRPIGLIAIIGRKPLADPQLAAEMLKLVAVRAAGELERRQAEEAIRISSDRYRSYIEVTGQLGWTTNSDGEVVEDLPSWRKYTGQTYEEIEDRGWARAIHPDDLQQVLRIWEKAVTEKTDCEAEYRIRRHDGLYRNFLVRGIPVFRHDGSIREWVGTCIDITERKAAVEKIRKLNEDLRQQARELQLAYNDMENFSSAASHDLRSPVITIDGFSDMLLEDHAEQLDDTGKDLARRIRDNARKMTQLIGDLFAFSRVSTSEVRKSEINMEVLARKLVEELKSTAGAGNIQFKVRELPSAYGDLTMINQVLLNLLANAIKFSRSKDAPLIEVGGYSEKDENVYFVQDNGIGFDMQLSDKLFGLFKRLHSDQEAEGTGIGLVIVKNIIGKHGGRVWAEGKPGEGARFFFTLPSRVTGTNQ